MITSKSNFFKGAVATLAALPLAAAATFTPAGSAQAAALSGSVSLSGTAIVPGGLNPATTTIKFSNPTGVSTGGDFDNFFPDITPGAGITINDLFLTRVGGGTATSGTYSTIPDGFELINFGERTLGTTTDTLTFVLDATQFIRTRIAANNVSITGPFGVAGNFIFDGATIASGFLNASISGTSSSYQLSLVTDPVAVPEPATLLGLGVVAAGMAVSRRRKTIPQ